jgi:hypothetical protein
LVHCCRLREEKKKKKSNKQANERTELQSRNSFAILLAIKEEESESSCVQAKFEGSESGCSRRSLQNEAEEKRCFGLSQRESFSHHLLSSAALDLHLKRARSASPSLILFSLYLSPDFLSLLIIV